MKRRVRLGAEAYELVDRQEPTPWEGALRVLDEQHALSLLRRLWDHHTVRERLGEFVKDLTQPGTVADLDLDARAILERLAQRLARGRLFLRPIKDRGTQGAAPGSGPGTAPAPRPTEQPATENPAAQTPAEKPKTFIKFRVVDERTGRPVANVRLTVKLPDGSTGRETTDAGGTVIFQNLDPGTCALTAVTDPLALEVLKMEG